MILSTVLFASKAYCQHHGGGGNEGFGHANQIELGGNFSYSSDANTQTQTANNQTTTNSSSTGTFTFEPTFGWFPGWVSGDAIQLELGLRPIYMSSSSGGTSASQFILGVEPTMYINTQSLAHPYVQGDIGFCNLSVPFQGGGSYSGGGFAFRIAGGVKLSLTPTSLLNVDIEYTSLNEGTDNGVGISDGIFTIGTGFSILIN